MHAAERIFHGNIPVGKRIFVGAFMNGSLRRRTAKLFGLLFLGLIASVALKPGTAHASWWNGDWSVRKTITIDTSSTGAAIGDPVGTTPVLVRLDVGDFTFDSANADGSDIRFVAADNKTPLAYHIEKFDHLLGQAFVWVNVPDLKPGAQTTIYLYYGNKKATAGDNAAATFDASTVLDYHFGEHGAPAKDWTSFGNNAQVAGTADDYALIGGGLRLNGQSTVTLPASGSLAWSGGNDLTWSVWFNETALQPDAILYSRTDGTNTVKIGVDNGVPFIEEDTAAGTQRSSAGTAITAANWHDLAVVAQGGASPIITLYVDGSQYATLNAALPALNTIAYLGGDATTGLVPAAPVAPPAAPATPDAATPGAATPAAAAPGTAATPPATPAAATTGFIGSIDELQISNAARTVGYIKFASVNQGTNPLAPRLVGVGIDEKTASWLSGYLVVILGSVTIDGWVIITILAIMAVISWAVMAEKASYVNRIAKANTAFTAAFRNITHGLTALEALANRKDGRDAGETDSLKAMEASPLYHVYHAGAEQIAMRFSMRPAGLPQILSAQSIAAIRSTLDASLVREVQQLNKSMVLLTIAIAGGPFLGLLGTVVGVMITFASIAAAGNVNVNAIAPGISAALVATVAGLIVAIPALFGYNYLTSRIRDVISDMQVFVDEFVTRMAEDYSPSIIEVSQAAE
jgi:biopolymer transport protein ExbB